MADLVPLGFVLRLKKRKRMGLGAFWPSDDVRERRLGYGRWNPRSLPARAGRLLPWEMLAPD